MKHTEQRKMTYDEMLRYLNILCLQVKQYDPDEIVGIARSGLPFATFISQMLDKPVGYYNLKNDELVLSDKNSKRIVLIDDNTCTGDTFVELEKNFYKKDIAWKFGVLFTDFYKTPDFIKEQIFIGIDLAYFATEIPCVFKSQTYMQRYRDL